jgi:hypothetical protein
MRLQVVEQIAALMTAAFAFIAAGAWNNAISAVVTEFLKSGNGWVALTIYALIVTVIAVFAVVYIAKAAARIKESEAVTGKKGAK